MDITKFGLKISNVFIVEYDEIWSFLTWGKLGFIHLWVFTFFQKKSFSTNWWTIIFKGQKDSFTRSSKSDLFLPVKIINDEWSAFFLKRIFLTFTWISVLYLVFIWRLICSSVVFGDKPDKNAFFNGFNVVVHLRLR